MKSISLVLLTSFILQSLAFAEAPTKVATHLRIMAANLTSTNDQSYDGPGIRIIKGLQADVVLVQEFRYKSNSKEELQEFARLTLGENAQYYRESEPEDRIPNGIISRYPIIESGEWNDPVVQADRDFAWARIDIPGKKDLWAISVHMKANKESKAKREGQARVIMKNIQEKIPAGDYVVLGGDSNAFSKTEKFFEVYSGADKETQGAHTKLSQPAFPSRHTPGLNAENAADQTKLEATNMGDRYPYDIILSDEDLTAIQVPVFLAPQGPKADDAGFTAPNGLVFDSTTFPRLDLVKPIEQSDSRPPHSQMQHLGVIKDFSIPAESSAPAPLKVSFELGGKNSDKATFKGPSVSPTKSLSIKISAGPAQKLAGSNFTPVIGCVQYTVTVAGKSQQSQVLRVPGTDAALCPEAPTEQTMDFTSALAVAQSPLSIQVGNAQSDFICRLISSGWAHAEAAKFCPTSPLSKNHRIAGELEIAVDAE